MSQIIPGFIIGLREGLEAFLIVTLILEYLNKIGRKELHGAVKKGMVTGLAVSVVFGALLWGIGSLMATGSSSVGKLWEALASFAAVLLITYFLYWMLHHGRNMVSEVHSSVRSNLSSKGMFILASVAVAREGAEIALFAFSADGTLTYLTGNMGGVLVAALLSYLIYRSLIHVDVGIIFRITLLYLILQGAYLFGYAIHEFLSALKALEIISSDALILRKLYDFGGTILDHKTGPLGIALNVTVGWYSRPEIIQMTAQIAYAAILARLWRKQLPART